MSGERPEWADMQGPVLSAYVKLNCAAYVISRIEDAAAARTWLGRIAGSITPAIRPPRGREAMDDCLNVALTCSGLRKLCAEAGTGLHGFPDPFLQGIAGTSHRRRILGDVGENDPGRWRWGGDSQPVDVLVMIFAPTAERLNAAVARWTSAAGLTEVARIEATPRSVAEGTEPFGFVDGISQPILKGSHAAERFPESRHLTALGEVVLGYENADGVVPPVPSLDACPEFGKNGSFLVARQLVQHVADFKAFLENRSGGDPLVAELLAAKIVGRRYDGTPLVPYADGRDNEFGFADDPFGYGCPIGAHIRRANPRDTFTDANAPSPDPLAANRHRILRRGQPYGQEGGAECGLLFVGLNADFERQFEFIQKDWVNNPAFAGVAAECDPLVGCRAGFHEFTIQALPAPARLTLPRFVTVRGGEYFFLPGLRALRHLAGRAAGGAHDRAS